MPSYDLTAQPWLPVLEPDDPVPRMVSLKEALVRAHEITAISDASPLVNVALHRLLLAVLHRCFAMPDDAAWKRLWDRERFDSATIDKYLDEQRPHFDLFHPERPFYQVPGLPAGLAVSCAKLAFGVSSGNNPTLFDHSVDAEPEALAPDEAARLLVAHQAFAIGGLITKLPGEPTGSDSSHLVKGAVVLARGDNLFETLMLNMVRVDGRHEAPFPFNPETDVPAWERQTPITRETVDTFGYLELLTWQNRRIFLFPEETADGRAVVRKVAILAGRAIAKDVQMHRRETMVAYRKLDNPARNQDPWVPVGFKPEKALWRDATALLQSGEKAERPKTLDWLRTLTLVDFEHWLLRLSAYGLSSDRANVFLWRGDQLDLPAAYLEDAELVTELRMGLSAAEDAERALHQTIYRLAAIVLEPEGTPDRARVDALVASLAPERVYWPALDIPFRRHIMALPNDPGASARLAREIERAAIAAFDSACDALATNGRGFRAAAEAGPAFRAFLARAIRPLLLEEVSA